jgi:hypothetical protein
MGGTEAGSGMPVLNNVVWNTVCRELLLNSGCDRHGKPPLSRKSHFTPVGHRQPIVGH